MMINSLYKKQVSLLLETIESVLDDEQLTLKGGTAINLFTMNMPRLSVDLDLTFQPITERDEFISRIIKVFQDMEKRLANYRPKIIKTKEGIPKQARLTKDDIEIKAEVNLILRGSVYPPGSLELCGKAQEMFEKNIKALCASFEDQYAGKFCAALDRQHPRDLFDVKLFFESRKFTEKIKKAFLVYLICGNRPMHEMIKPTLLDQRILFTEQFQGMVENSPTYEELELAREKLIDTVDMHLSSADKEFLMSVKKGTPNWDHLGLNNVELLPGVKWKMMNIERMSPERRNDSLKKLERKLT